MSHFLNNTAVATNYLRLPQLKRNNCHNTLQTFNQTVYEGLRQWIITYFNKAF